MSIDISAQQDCFERAPSRISYRSASLRTSCACDCSGHVPWFYPLTLDINLSTTEKCENIIKARNGTGNT